MHEMTIAMNIVDIVCKKASEENATKINSVILEIGELSGIMIDSLEFCFEAACKNTIASGAKLKIQNIEGRAFCKICKKDYNLKTDFSPCPTCNDFNIEVIAGKELSIKSFNID